MISASRPSPVFIKNVLDDPSFRVVIILEVDVKEEPPYEDTLVVAGSKDNNFRTVESSSILYNNEKGRDEHKSIPWLKVVDAQNSRHDV